MSQLYDPSNRHHETGVHWEACAWDMRAEHGPAEAKRLALLAREADDWYWWARVLDELDSLDADNNDSGPVL